MRPEVAYPAEPVQAGEHFASGVNHPGEVRGLALSARHVGITAGELREGLLEELELFGGAGGSLRLFVDSGAFSEVAFGPEGISVVRPIGEAAWSEIFALQSWAARTYGTRAYLVAPDRVGCQATTLTRLERYAPHVAELASHRANIIVPVQKGELAMSAMFRRACEILNLRTAPIAGVPMKKDATSFADLAELVDSLPWFGARIHLLGIGPESKRFAAAVRVIKAHRPNASITSDSVTIRRLVGRTNGRGGGPRPLTRYQDQARELGLDSAGVKAFALQRHGADEHRAEREAAHAAGWFDTELYDSAEEAAAHAAAGYPEDAPELVAEVA